MKAAKAFDITKGEVTCVSSDHDVIGSFVHFKFEDLMVDLDDGITFWWQSEITALDFAIPETGHSTGPTIAKKPARSDDIVAAGSDDAAPSSKPMKPAPSSKPMKKVVKPAITKKPACQVVKSSERKNTYSRIYHRVREAWLSVGKPRDIAAAKAREAANEATKDM